MKSDFLPPSGSFEHELLEQVHLGESAKKFLSSDLAKYILNSAEQMAVEAQNQLGKIDPTDVAGIVKLQKTIGIFDHFATSLSEIVAAGDSAYQLYLKNLEEE